MEWRPDIGSDPQVLRGAVCFRGTRIPVSAVPDNPPAGELAAAILDEYPGLTPDHVQAAIGYGAGLARGPVVPLPV